MTTICYIVPYFGQLPESFFRIWLKSAASNPTVDWLLFIDDNTPYSYPRNVKVRYTTFEQIKKRIQKLFEFNITLNSPYRLCDFRPAYGEVFKEELTPYDFWGYCDFDQCWGDIRAMLTEDILTQYDKIGFRGHSTLFRNNEEMRNLYRQGNYMSCFSDVNNTNHFFDEEGISEISDKLGIKTFKKMIFANITPLFWNFQLSLVDGIEKKKNEHRLFSWENGHLFCYSLLNNEIVKDEYMYVHFLRRRMSISFNLEAEKILIVPNKFIHFKNITNDIIKEYSKNNMLLYWIEFIRTKWKKFSIQRMCSYIKNRYKATRNWGANV